MSEDWPVSVGARDYHPVPDSWVKHGHDDGTGEPRIYAVSVARIPQTRDVLAIRYVHPQSGQTLVVRTKGTVAPDDSGLIPASLDAHATWPRSRTPEGHKPTGSAREPEMAHLCEVWGGRVAEIPAPGEATDEQRQPVTDGGSPQ